MARMFPERLPADTESEAERRLFDIFKSLVDTLHDAHTYLGAPDLNRRYGGRRPDECLRFAVACGAESIRHMGAGVIDPQEVDRLMAEVSVETLAEPAVHSG